MVQSNPHIPWDWGGLSYNPNVTCDFIQAHIHKRWSWTQLSLNPNITCEFVQATQRRWGISDWWRWNFLFRNKFSKHPAVARKKIQRWWKKKYYYIKYGNMLTQVLTVPPNHDSTIGKLFPHGGAHVANVFHL